MRQTSRYTNHRGQSKECHHKPHQCQHNVGIIEFVMDRVELTI